MPKKEFGAEQIVMLLRQIEVSMAQGKSAPEASDRTQRSNIGRRRRKHIRALGFLPPR